MSPSEGSFPDIIVSTVPKAQGELTDALPNLATGSVLALTVGASGTGHLHAAGNEYLVEVEVADLPGARLEPGLWSAEVLSSEVDTVTLHPTARLEHGTALEEG